MLLQHATVAAQGGGGCLPAYRGGKGDAHSSSPQRVVLLPFWPEP